MASHWMPFDRLRVTSEQSQVHEVPVTLSLSKGIQREATSESNMHRSDVLVPLR